MVLKQVEIIDELQKKESKKEVSVGHLKQTPITYIAAVAAGFPIYTSTAYSVNYLGMFGNLNLP